MVHLPGPVGELLVVIGLAFYPNLGTAEAFAIVNHRGRHTTVRAHRKLGTDRMDMTLGPFSFEVVEPFRQWRLRSTPTPWRRHRLNDNGATDPTPARGPPTGSASTSPGSIRSAPSSVNWPPA